MFETDKTPVLWNTSSRLADRALALKHLLAGDERFQVIETKSADDARRAARQAVDEGLDRIVAAGGDGTMNTVANAIGGQVETSLAVLPLGTGNDFCRNMGLPIEYEEARHLLLGEHRRQIDLMKLTAGDWTRYCLNAASGGNSVRVTELLTDELKSTWGPWVFLRGGLDVLADLKAYRTTVQIDEQPAEQRSLWNFTVANGRFSAGGLDVAPDAEVDDGQLDFVCIDDGGVLDVVGLANRLMSSDYREHECVICSQAKKIRIEIEPLTKVVMDGEIVEGDRLIFEAVPNALSVIVGPPKPDAADSYSPP